MQGSDTQPRYVIVEAGRNDDRYWSGLWSARDDSNVHTAFADTVLPQCPLLSAERADHIVLPSGLQAPADSAWVHLRVDLATFVSSAGAIDGATLKRALENCVDTGEALHDETSWPTPEVRQDSWLNRRLGICVSGLGDILHIKGLAPTEHGSLRFLNQLLLFVRGTLLSRSRQIARCKKQLPAITLSDPSRQLPRGGIREDWQRRWREAATATRVRHRNLLVMSPWALFPSESRADYRYSELLPLLRHADACAFKRSQSISHWNVNEFKRFHQRARAVLQQRGATPRFAKHV